MSLSLSIFHSVECDSSQFFFCSFSFRSMHIYKILNVYEEWVNSCLFQVPLKNGIFMEQIAYYHPHPQWGYAIINSAESQLESVDLLAIFSSLLMKLAIAFEL